MCGGVARALVGNVTVFGGDGSWCGVFMRFGDLNRGILGALNWECRDCLKT